VARKGAISDLNLDSYSMGYDYASALGSGLKMSKIEKLNLASNRLKEKGTMKVLDNLNDAIREIDLSSNRIGASPRCISQLDKILQNKQFDLQCISL